MPDPLQLSLQDRPDPAVLLIDAVINRQSDLAQRLSQQLVHRQGVEALEHCLQGPLSRSCGEESVQWLRQQLSTTATDLTPAAARPAMGSLLRDALSEALAPLRPEQAAAAPGAVEVKQQLASDDPWTLQALQPPLKQPVALVTAKDSTPAPLPADLADLRAWLHSDAA